ncbi:hypothetical protein BDY17DRAFT_117663 [Neohortaea acidophila]|uniref:Uncharacterized protein n=1 Tax=Neohortaea acidophila TaxID=245834 RepID=A0A6A6PVW9_9PEZI|nr:uncharacterized protein BDY17DRAFT_117663 [Neohortaea acidophila]KAF2483916.1 hypothetical protein BDY17DRAFT_117663 [Neohortaea acidophila]
MNEAAQWVAQDPSRPVGCMLCPPSHPRLARLPARISFSSAAGRLNYPMLVTARAIRRRAWWFVFSPAYLSLSLLSISSFASSSLLRRLGLRQSRCALSLLGFDLVSPLPSSLATLLSPLKTTFSDVQSRALIPFPRCCEDRLPCSMKVQL